MRNELSRLSAGGEPSKDTNPNENAHWLARKNSIASKRQSMIRLLSEGEATTPTPTSAFSPPPHAVEDAEEGEEDEEETPLESQAEIEDMREEVDEARKLAEEWELKYKEMQRQMNDLEGFSGKKLSTAGIEPATTMSGANAGLQRMISSTSDVDAEVSQINENHEAEQDDDWMKRREIRSLESKLRNTKDKKEVVFRERKLLAERIESLIKGIEAEMEARKHLKKEIKEMNEAFKREINDMLAEERTAAELEECYFSDDDLVPNKSNFNNKVADDDEIEEEWTEFEEEEVEETLDDIIEAAEDQDEEDAGRDLFENYRPGDDCSDTEEGENDNDVETRLSNLNKKIGKHSEQVQTMRRSNFLLKSKIDRLYDILQMQKEKHHDLRQELSRTLSDIQ